MNLKTWAANNGWSMGAVADQLTLICRKNEWMAIPVGRLNRLRSGGSLARSQEVAALAELTKGQATTFRDEVGNDK